MPSIILEPTEPETLNEADDFIIDAEFKIIADANEQAVTTPSGVSILFQNWSNQH